MEPLIKTPEQAKATLQQTLENSIKSPENWVELLKTVANNHKYRFRDQILIHAQKPDVTACAEYALWRDKLNRQVRRGVKSIRLLDETDEKPKLRHIYDISDTFIVDDTKKAGSQWVLAENSRELAAKMIQTVQKRETVPLIRDSISYIVMYRCGLSPDETFSLEDFSKDLEDFRKTAEIISNDARSLLLAIEQAEKDARMYPQKNTKKGDATHDKLQSDGRSAVRGIVGTHTAGSGGDATIVTWEQAAKQIRELLGAGRYMPQSDLDKVDNHEIKALADSLWYLHHDRADGYEFHFPL